MRALLLLLLFLARPAMADDDYIARAAAVRAASQGFSIANEDGYEGEALSDFKRTPGAILSARGNSCLNDKYPAYSADGAQYSGTERGYYDIIKSMSAEARPIALVGNQLLNADGVEVATISAPMAGTSGSSVLPFSGNNEVMRTISFKSGEEAVVMWNKGLFSGCKENKLASMVDGWSACHLCPYVVMIVNEISYIFDFMFSTFRVIILAFLTVFGALYVAQRFWGAMQGWPFSNKFDGYLKELFEKSRVIIIASVIAIVPPKTIFEFTAEPIIELSLGAANAVLRSSSTLEQCDGEKIVDAINKKRAEDADKKVLPPIAKGSANKTIETMRDSYFISKATVGRIVCFMSDNVRANGRYVALGQALLWPPSSATLFGLLIFAFFLGINLWISFYVLDAFLKILELAILWPFMVFGYAFNWIGFSMNTIVSVAKNFGFTMIALAVFSLFSTLMISTFTFGEGSAKELIDAAIAADSEKMLSQAVTGGDSLIAFSKFLFILYAMFYLYSKLSEFTSKYSGGSIGDKPIGKAVQSLFTTTRKYLSPTNIFREPQGFIKKPSEKKDEPAKGSEPSEPKPAETPPPPPPPSPPSSSGSSGGGSGGGEGGGA